MRRRTSVSSFSLITSMSRPSKTILPASGLSRPMSILSMTLLPEPEAPMTVTVSPR